MLKLFVVILVVLEGVASNLNTPYQCSPGNSIFTKAKKSVQVYNINNVADSWKDTLNDVSSPYICQCRCDSEPACKSAAYNTVYRNCTLKDINRRSLGVKIIISENVEFYEKGECNANEDEEGRFIAMVDNVSDCKDIQQRGYYSSGIYNILKADESEYYAITCDMDLLGGGWTIIQRRVDDSVLFNRTWQEYKRGFGEINGNFWYGLENIHDLTWSTRSMVLFELESVTGEKYHPAHDEFKVNTESNKYQLTVGSYVYFGIEHTLNFQNGISGFEYHNGYNFSTFDNPSAVNGRICPNEFGNSGWWYRTCSKVMLNGHYGHNSDSGIVWNTITFRNQKQISLKYSKMMVRKD